MNNCACPLFVSRSHFSTAAVIISVTLASIGSDAGIEPDRKQLTTRYLAMDSTETARQDTLRAEGLQEIEPVLLAEPGETPHNHLHIGWPVATTVGDTIVVAARTYAGKESHSKGKIPYKGPLAISSSDGGKTWSKPVYPHGQNNIELTGREGMIGLGTMSSGRVILCNKKHVFRSEDKGKTWTYTCAEGLSGAGPRIIEHPKYGLIWTEGATFGISFFVSKDEGVTWEESKFLVDRERFSPCEPALFTYENKLALLVRNYSGPCASNPKYKCWLYYAQFVPENLGSAEAFKNVDFDCKLTNISTGARMDTNDVIYNPVTKRIEAIQTKRNQGFPYRDDAYMTLNLWSIDPDKFFEGDADWRFECTLLRSKGKYSRGKLPNAREGMHPAGSVIDEKRNVQHVFIFGGNRTHKGKDGGKTGLFRISRTLDTDKLRDRVRALDNFDNIYKIDEDFDSLDQWTLNGDPARLSPGRETSSKSKKGNSPSAGLVKTDEHGLYIKTEAVGYCGIHNEKTIVTQQYHLEFKAKIDRYAADGDSLGVSVNYCAQRQHVILREDGLYEMADQDKVRKIKEIDMDSDWHLWSVKMVNGKAEIRVDGNLIANTSAIMDDRLGLNDASVSVYVRTTSASDPAELRMKFFRLENLEQL